MWLASNSQWFVSELGVISGPFGAERIRIMMKWGKLSTRACVCDESNGAWIPIHQSVFASDVAAQAIPPGPESAAPPVTALFREGSSSRRLCVAVAVAVAIMLVFAALSGA
jgi:hypothetical protein